MTDELNITEPTKILQMKQLVSRFQEKLIDEYVNFIMDSMSLKLKDELLFEYLVNDYKEKSQDELIVEIRENYGDEWFEERNLK
jgi:hypothetical protein